MNEAIRARRLGADLKRLQGPPDGQDCRVIVHDPDDARHAYALRLADLVNEGTAQGWSVSVMPGANGEPPTARVQDATPAPAPSASERRVFKYRLAVDLDGVVHMPESARPLSVGVQNDSLYLWAECDPAAPLVEWHVCVAGTGWPLPPNRGEFVGACRTEDGRFVWHVYARPVPA